MYFLKIWKTNFLQIYISKFKFWKIGKNEFHISFLFANFFFSLVILRAFKCDIVLRDRLYIF